MKDAKKRQDREAAILECIELHANTTVGEIARGTGLKEHIVRRAVDSLLEQKLIHSYIHLNVYPLGFFEVDLFVAFADHSRQAVGRIIHWCISIGNVCVLAEIHGQFDLKIGLTVRSMLEVHQFVQEATDKFHFPFARKEVVTVIELYDFGAHKAHYNPKAEALRFGFGDSVYDLTPEDHHVLKVFTRHPELAPSAMAKQLGISASTFAYRIERLEKAGRNESRNRRVQRNVVSRI